MRNGDWCHMPNQRYGHNIHDWSLTSAIAASDRVDLAGRLSSPELRRRHPFRPEPNGNPDWLMYPEILNVPRPMKPPSNGWINDAIAVAKRVSMAVFWWKLRSMIWSAGLPAPENLPSLNPSNELLGIIPDTDDFSLPWP